MYKELIISLFKTWNISYDLKSTLVRLKAHFYETKDFYPYFYLLYFTFLSFLGGAKNGRKYKTVACRLPN